MANIVADDSVSGPLERKTQHMIIVRIDGLWACVLIKIYLDRYLQQRSKQLLDLVS